MVKRHLAIVQADIEKAHRRALPVDNWALEWLQPQQLQVKKLAYSTSTETGNRLVIYDLGGSLEAKLDGRVMRWW